MNRKTICLRAETKVGEYRTPLVPEDVKKLLQADLRFLLAGIKKAISLVIFNTKNNSLMKRS